MMKVILANTFLCLSYMTFAGEITSTDYKEIKLVLKNKISQSMLEHHFIKNELWDGALSEIYLTTDILSSKNSAEAKVIVLPEEENCDCQDVFKAYATINKKDDLWEVDKSTLRIIHIPTDQ